MGLTDRSYRLQGKGLLDYKRAKKGEWHLPLANYCGPGTNVRDRIKSGVIPTTATDGACRAHDIAYHDIGAKLKRGTITRTEAKKQVKAVDTQLMKSALYNKMNIRNALNPVEHLHNTSVMAGIGAKKLAEMTGLLDELKFVEGDDEELLGSGRKKKKSKKKNPVKGLQKRFKKKSV